MYQKILNKKVFLEIFIYRLFSFKGRASRKEYIIKFFTMLFFYCVAVYTSIYTDHSNSWIILVLDSLLVITLLVYTIQMFPLTHRRLHDLNASGWWQLITFIPCGQLMMIGFIFFKGTKGTNRFGNEPEY